MKPALVFQGVPSKQPISALQQSASSLDCLEDAAETLDVGIVVKGTVSVAQYDLAPFLDGFHMTIGPSPYESIAVSFPDSLPLMLVEGQVVEVTGDYVEYFCNSQLAATSIEVVGTELAPAPVTVFPSDFADTAESWDGSLVSMAGLEVGDSPNFATFGEINTTSLIDGVPLKIDDSIIGGGC